MDYRMLPTVFLTALGVQGLRRLCLLMFLLTPALAQAGLFSSAAEDTEELTQHRTALKLEIDGMARVYDVVFNLESAATSLCGDDAGWIPGFAVAARGHFDSADRDAAVSLGYDQRARVMYVAQRSDAARQGLLRGDLIVAVNGKEIDESRDAHEQVQQALAAARGESPIRLGILDDSGQAREISFRMTRVCDYTPHMVRSHVINAASTGWDIHVTTGLLDFLDSDTELAAVLAHEIGHSMMSHVAKKLGHKLLGKLLDSIVSSTLGPLGSVLVSAINPGERLGGLAYSQAYEIEADYVALYLMALAGYDIGEAPKLWRKMAVEFPDLSEKSYLATHPSTPERVLVQELTASEIHRKVADGEPLKPEVEKRMSQIQVGDVQ